VEEPEVPSDQGLSWYAGPEERFARTRGQECEWVHVYNPLLGDVVCGAWAPHLTTEYLCGEHFEQYSLIVSIENH
jgi:hypothetical protein